MSDNLTIQPQIPELYQLTCITIAEIVKRLHAHQRDESGARDPGWYDNEGTELRNRIGVLKEVRDQLEKIL